jgi:hypothetical protein
LHVECPAKGEETCDRIYRSLGGKTDERDGGKMSTGRLASDNDALRLELGKVVKDPPHYRNGVLYRLLKPVIDSQVKVAANGGDVAGTHHVGVPPVVEARVAENPGSSMEMQIDAARCGAAVAAKHSKHYPSLARFSSNRFELDASSRTEFRENALARSNQSI